MSLATGAAIAAAVVAVFAAGIAICSAEFTRRQAVAAKRQAEAAEDQATAAEAQVVEARRQADSAAEQARIAREQAEIAQQQADAAWEQVAESRRANDEMAEERAAMKAINAVRWTASIDGSLSRIHVRNQGNETARGVEISRYGADEDWEHGPPSDVVQFEEVRAGDYAPYPLRGRAFNLPGQVYVAWEGAAHPRAVPVELERNY